MKRFILLPLLYVFLLFSCDKPNILPDPQPIHLNEKTRQVVSADNQFGLELFRQLKGPGIAEKNIMISPLSVSLALSMTYNGASGQTRMAFDNTLHFQGITMEDVNKSAFDLSGALLSVDPKVNLKIANSIWYRAGFSVESDFINRNQTYYNAVVQALDFNAPQSVDKINNWVSDQTEQKIDKIVGQLNPRDRMLLINAVYFKGEWRNKFQSAETATQPFYLENGESVSVQMMQTTGNYSYFENNQLDALEMPYGRGNFSMVVLLPKAGFSVSDILDVLDAGAWNSWLENFVSVDNIPVSIPKFKFTYDNSLKNVLSALGLSVAFSDTADFTGINKNGNLFISEVEHKTFIEVNEEGTEAAAATAVTVGTTSVGPGRPFVADHPFVFVIKEKYTNAILFIGILANPNLKGSVD